jgi:MFS family permease
MENTSYRWVIVAAGGVIGCVALGSLFALPVFLKPMAESTGWSMTGLSSAMTIAFIVMGLAGMGWGAFSDKYGPRPAIFSGGILLVVSMFLLSYCTSLLAFQLVFGVLFSIAVAAFFAPMMAAVAGWFDTHRSLAISLVSAGMGMAPLTMSPLAAYLIERYSWQTSYQIMAVVAGVLVFPAAFLMRRPPALEMQATSPIGSAPQEPMNMTLRQALLSPQFAVLSAAFFFCCATHSGPIFHTVSYAISCGIPAMTAVTIYSIEGLAGMGGRIAFGLMGDKFGAKTVLSAGLLAQAVGALGYFYANNLSEFYAAAVVFGFIYAGVMPLYSVIIRENFPLPMIGTIIGGTGIFSSLGMATGPLLGGWIFDVSGNYGWLYISSFGMGIAACLIAFLFRPFPQAVAKLDSAPA